MSLLTLTCPHCAQVGKLPHELMGKTVACPRCSKSFAVPFIKTTPPELPKAPIVEAVRELPEPRKDDLLGKARRHFAKMTPEERKKTYWGIAAFFVAVVLCPLSSLMNTGDEKEKAKEAGKPPEVPIETTAPDLFGDFDANSIAAESRYKGKMVQVRGRIVSIGKEILGAPYVVLGNGDEFSPFGVQCIFPRDKHGLESVSKGQVVTVRGKCRSKLGNVLVDHCELVR